MRAAAAAALLLAACGAPAPEDAAARPGEGLFRYRSGPPPAVQVERTIPGPSRALTLLSFAGPGGRRVPAALWLPSGNRPVPGLLLAHGMPGHRRSLETLAAAYADAGVAVLSITAPWSRVPSDLRGPSLFTLPHFDERDREELVRYVEDLRRALDLMVARPDVDASRLAFVGHSYGATAGAILAGLDHRPRAFVLIAGIPGLPDRFVDSAGGPSGLPPGARPSEEALRRWRDALRPVDATLYVRHHRRPLLFQLGSADPLARPDRARELARAAGEGVEVREYDAGHTLSPAAWEDQARWLAPILGFPARRFTAPARLGRPGRGEDGRLSSRSSRPARRRAVRRRSS